jgi:hypothetical protein
MMISITCLGVPPILQTNNLQFQNDNNNNNNSNSNNNNNVAQLLMQGNNSSNNMADSVNLTALIQAYNLTLLSRSK